MMISFVFLFLLLGGGAALLGLIVFAIVSKKLWVIPVAGGLVFLGLIASGLLVAIGTHRVSSSVSMQPATMVIDGTQVIDGVSGMHQTMTYGSSHVNTYPVGNGTVFVSGPHWSRLLIFVVLIAFVIGLVIRNGMSPAVRHGLGRAWPAVAVALFIGVYFFARSNDSYERVQANARTARDAAETTAARKQFLLAHEQAVAREKAAEKIRKQLKIAQVDIHAEMDQFDAPRIPVSPDTTVPKAPDAPAVPAALAATASTSATAESNNKRADKTNKTDSIKTAAASNSKRKKSDKTPASGDAKQSQSVAQAKAAAETKAKKEDTASNDKLAMVAEAEPDKPKPRPAWVDEAPKRTGNTRREVIATDLYESIDECYHAADVYLLLKTYQRMQQITGKPYNEGPLPTVTFKDGQTSAGGQLVPFFNGSTYWSDWRISTLSNMGIGVDYVRREIVAKDSQTNESREYVDTVNRSFGPMKKLYLQIEFTSAVDNDLRRHWDAHERRERFAIAGVGAGSILGLLGLVFAILKIDTATKGYYTKRLFIGVPLAIIGVCFLLMLLDKYTSLL